VELEQIVQIAFVAAAVVTTLSLLGAVLDRVSNSVLAGGAVLLGIGAAAAWVAFGVRPDRGIAVAAGGITLAFGAQLAAVKLREVLRAAHRTDEQIARAQARLGTVIAKEADERSAELERTLARARADSVSIIAEQERRLAEERRAAAAERSRTTGDELGEALTASQQQVEARLAAWRDDLDRAQRAVGDQLTALAQRQKQLISEAEARIAADAERLQTESEQQRAGLVRLRDEVARATQETVQAGTSELEGYASERRRALHELNERIRRRERQLMELIEREESEAVRRIQMSFADVERRQIEQLERILTRATTSYSDAATQEFADAIKAARENAGTRLSRELDRAVQAFAWHRPARAWSATGSRPSQSSRQGSQAPSRSSGGAWTASQPTRRQSAPSWRPGSASWHAGSTKPSPVPDFPFQPEFGGKQTAGGFVYATANRGNARQTWERRPRSSNLKAASAQRSRAGACMS
jgi:hypothetical protein